MTPSQIAQKHWGRFLQDTESLSKPDYRSALEELQSMCDMHLMALDEEEDE